MIYIEREKRREKERNSFFHQRELTEGPCVPVRIGQTLLGVSLIDFCSPGPLSQYPNPALHSLLCPSILSFHAFSDFLGITN